MHRRLPGLSLLLALAALAAPALARPDPAPGTPRAGGKPLRVFIRAGPNTNYGPGVHDHPRFLTEWKTLLAARGAVVAGSLAFPTEAELASTDVLVVYAQDAGSIHGAERARLEAWLKRGGGIVAIHDALAGDDPTWWSSVVGGAYEFKHSREFLGTVGLYFPSAKEHPITHGVANFDFEEELYYDLRLAPGIDVLAKGFHSVFSISPQMWTYELDGHRAFAAVEGHRIESFAHPAWRTLLLRGIAWAGKRDPELLTIPAEREQLPYPPGGPLKPELASRPFEVEPGFDVRLVAAEPLVVNPISIAWDPAGRLWVALTPGYPDKAADSHVPAHDSIVILSDSDGDGRMDKRKVFHDKLDLVTSLVHHRDGVIVAAAPDILWLRDTNGDDVADETVVLYTGFGIADTHAVVSNLRAGLDGWIYATQGYSGDKSLHVKGKDNRDFGSIPGGVFRFKPDGSAIESLITGGSNIWGIALDWDDETFFSLANASHLRHLVVPQASLATGRIGAADSWKDITDHDRVFPILEHDREPYRQIDNVGGFTAACGDIIYDGGAWPAPYRGSHFVCEPTVNLVHQDLVRPAGPTFAATKPHEKEFLAAKDLWFRPVHLAVGPDGALYVLDFYNQAVVHDDARGPEKGPSNATVRPDRDDLHGRIWRVQHKSATASPAPTLAGASDATLLQALAHPNGWRRRTAHRLLAEAASVKVEDLRRVLADPASATARLHALWLLTGRGALLPADLVQALRDPEPGVRKNAWRIAALGEQPLPEGSLGALEHEADARVLLVALATAGPAIAALDHGPKLLLRLTEKLTDDWSKTALLHAFGAHPEVLLVHALAQKDRAAWLALVEASAREVGRKRDPQALAQVLEAAAATPGPSTVAALGKLLDFWPLDHFPDSLPAIEEALARLLGSADEATSRAAIPLAARLATSAPLRAKVAALVARELETVASASAPTARRIEALRTLLRIPEEREKAVAAAAPLLAPSVGPDVQVAAIGALGDIDEPFAADRLATAFRGLTPLAREKAFKQIAERPIWSLRLLAQVAASHVTTEDLGSDRVTRLLEHPDAAVARRAKEVFGGRREVDPLDPGGIIAKLLPEVQQRGDAERGRLVFEKNCAVCHTFRGAGHAFGPDLSGMGAHGAAGLLPSILDPNRVVDPAFQLHEVRTVDGRHLSGILARDEPDRIAIRTSDGETEVLRSAVASVKATGRSPMPTGFEALGTAELRDLLTHLQAGFEDYLTLDLGPLFNASTWHGLYDAARDPTRMEFAKYGAMNVAGVPYELIDPASSATGYNAIVLKGGAREDWDSKRRMPKRVEIPVGRALQRVYVLGGIAAWGYPFSSKHEPAVKWTWRYADGTSEERVLTDGVEFADWVERHDVPGSDFVPGLVKEGSRGQVRAFRLAPKHHGVVVASIVLESFDNDVAPTFLALTAQLSAPPLPAELAQTFQALSAGLEKEATRDEALRSGARLLDPALPPATTLAAIDALAELEDPGIADLLTDAYPRLPGAARERAWRGLVERAEWTHRLLNAIATGRVPIAGVDPAALSAIKSHPEDTVARRALAVLGEVGTSATPRAAAPGTDHDRARAAPQAGYTVLPLTTACSASTTSGLFDARTPERLELARRGTVEVGGVPFEILDPDHTASGFDAIALKGGLKPDWDSKLKRPRRVEIPVGRALDRVHVLGGIAAWGYPFTKSRAPLVKWTWYFADGTHEETVLRDGVEFADWIERNNVSGSSYARGLVKRGGKGQLRVFTVEQGRHGVVVSRIALESFDGDAAPVFLALTAEVGGGHGRVGIAWIAAIVGAALLAAAAGVRRVRRRSSAPRS